jgi:hypothetical protein
MKREIPMEIRSIFRHIFKVPAFHVTWSEQGMKPENGWNFDVNMV